jgi:hypothetical protein
MLIKKSFYTFQQQRLLPSLLAEQKKLAARLAGPELQVCRANDCWTHD